MSPGTTPDPPRLADLAERLGSIAEELADLALDELRRAAEDHDDGVEPRERDEALRLERRLTRARRAVEKAAAILAPPPLDLG